MENKILTGFAVINRAEGKRVAYTHSIVDEEGNIKEDNVKKSFIALDPELLELIKKIDEYIITNKLEG